MYHFRNVKKRNAEDCYFLQRKALWKKGWQGGRKGRRKEKRDLDAFNTQSEPQSQMTL